MMDMKCIYYLLLSPLDDENRAITFDPPPSPLRPKHLKANSSLIHILIYYQFNPQVF